MLAGQGLRAVPGNRGDFDIAQAAFDDNFLTTDRAQFGRMQAVFRAHPALSLGAPTLSWLAAALTEMAVLAPRPSPVLPALAAVGSLEKIVDPAAIAARMERWPGGTLQVHRGAEHEILMEAPEHRDRFLDAVLALFAAAARERLSS
ncbi:hypothetical protein CCR87_07645 [Rhodobaculum claviforme]|uniref:Uncharacterized protein n=1 Tax=Rhodobaculum claviforme TaxID=1549854 RepID=A0A934TJG2_9RHOB|nr:hypothetical protein [Rhodobaculum claviforme]